MKMVSPDGSKTVDVTSQQEEDARAARGWKAVRATPAKPEPKKKKDVDEA